MLMREYPAYSHIQDMDMEEFMMLLDIRHERYLKQLFAKEKAKNKLTLTFEQWLERREVEETKMTKMDKIKSENNISQEEFERLQRLNV